MVRNKPVITPTIDASASIGQPAPSQSSFDAFMTFRPFTLLLLASALHAHAAPRPWRSADGQGTVQGEFVKRDATSVTIRRSDLKEVSIPLDKLDSDDRTWVNANHPLAGTGVPNKSAVFDELVFGDDRAKVLAKLKASKFVALTVDEVFLGRSGLNGVFRTQKKIGGLDASLFFDWDDNGGLKEITLHTDPLPASDLNDKMTPCWKQFGALLSTLHGKPIHEDPRLVLSSIKDGTMVPTHLWQLEKSGSVVLGAARDGDKYQVVVRFTQKTVVPVSIP
jgi:hypothetical protein